MEEEEEEGEEREGRQQNRDASAMKIAWRYRDMPKVKSSFSSQFGHNYDLTVSMPTARVEAVERVHFDVQDKPARLATILLFLHYIFFSLPLSRSARELYTALKEAIEDTIHKSHFSVDEFIPKQVHQNKQHTLFSL